MDIIRPIHPNDLHDLMKLTKHISHGITSLPKDKNILYKRILESQDGFAKKAEEPRGETYLFVLEDLDTGKMVGVSCNVKDIRSVRESVKRTIGGIKDEKVESEPYIISNSLKDYRACLGHLRVDSPDSVQIERETALALKVKIGDPIRFVPLCPPSHWSEKKD